MSFTVTFNAWWVVGLLIVCPVLLELMLPEEHGWGAGCRGVVIIGSCWVLALGVAIGRLLA